MKELLSVLCFLAFFPCFYACTGSLRAEGETASFYVAPDGDDSDPGTYEQPFASLERARDAVRSLREEDGWPEGGVVVHLRGGRYRMEESFELGRDDSGEPGAPVTYSAFEGEEVRLMGGVDLDPSGFEPVTEEAVLNRLPQGSRGEVYQMDLSGKGLDYGKIPFTGHSLAYMPWIPRRDPAPELVFNGEIMTLARWPNEGYTRIGAVVDEGSIPRDGDSPDEDDYRGAVFEYTGDRPERWSEAEEVWMFGYWARDWSDQTIRIESVDRDEGTISTEQPSAYGVREGQRFYAYNLLEEIEQPGEWYLNRENGILYFYPPDDLEGAEVQFSQLTDPLVAMEETSHITLKDVILEAGRGSALVMSGGEGNSVDSCTIRRMAGQGVRVDGGRDNGVFGCTIYNIGGRGIEIGGGDREKLIGAGNYAENNHIHNFARLVRTYAPAVRLTGVGNRASHNKIHDAPHMAVSFSGNNHIMEYNEIFDVARETDDVGAIYTGRTWTSRGNVIRHNFFHDIRGIDGGHGAMAVYLDDGFSGALVEGNVFYNIKGRSFLNGGGHMNILRNNLFINCDRPVWIDDRLLNWASHHVENMTEGLERYLRFEAWKEQYPELEGLLEAEPFPDVPRDNIVEANILFKSGDLEITEKAEKYGTIRNNLKTDRDPGFADADSLDFRIEDDSWIYEELPEFDPIPFHMIGLHDE